MCAANTHTWRYMHKESRTTKRDILFLFPMATFKHRRSHCPLHQTKRFHHAHTALAVNPSHTHPWCATVCLYGANVGKLVHVLSHRCPYLAGVVSDRLKSVSFLKRSASICMSVASQMVLMSLQRHMADLRRVRDRKRKKKGKRSTGYS
jgi:hypothetical protein